MYLDNYHKVFSYFFNDTNEVLLNNMLNWIVGALQNYGDFIILDKQLQSR